MSTKKIKKIWSTVLQDGEEAQIRDLIAKSGVPESVILRGLIRTSLKQKKLDLLKLVRIGSY